MTTGYVITYVFTGSRAGSKGFYCDSYGDGSQSHVDCFWDSLARQGFLHYVSRAELSECTIDDKGICIDAGKNPVSLQCPERLMI